MSSSISSEEELEVYFRSSETWYSIDHKFVSESQIIFSEGSGANLILPASVNPESLSVVILNKLHVIVSEEILYFPTNFFTKCLDLAGVNFNSTWSNHSYKKTSDIAVFHEYSMTPNS